MLSVVRHGAAKERGTTLKGRDAIAEAILRDAITEPIGNYTDGMMLSPIIVETPVLGFVGSAKE